PLGEAALGQAASPLAPTLRLGGSLLLTGMAAFCGVAIAEIVEAALCWRSVRSPWSSGLPVRADARRTTWVALGLVALGLVVVGAEEDVGTDRYVNEIVAFGPDGKISGRYRKHHLVPFGEYVPGRSLLKHLFNLADVPLDGIPGPGPGIVHTTAGPLGLLIS